MSEDCTSRIEMKGIYKNVIFDMSIMNNIDQSLKGMIRLFCMNEYEGFECKDATYTRIDKDSVNKFIPDLDIKEDVHNYTFMYDVNDKVNSDDNFVQCLLKTVHDLITEYHDNVESGNDVDEFKFSFDGSNVYVETDSEEYYDIYQLMDGIERSLSISLENIKSYINDREDSTVTIPLCNRYVRVSISDLLDSVYDCDLDDFDEDIRDEVMDDIEVKDPFDAENKDYIDGDEVLIQFGNGYCDELDDTFTVRIRNKYAVEWNGRFRENSGLRTKKDEMKEVSALVDQITNLIDDLYKKKGIEGIRLLLDNLRSMIDSQ